MPRLPPIAADGKILPAVRAWVEKTLRAVGERTEIPFAVRFADGAELRTRDAAPEFTIVFRDPVAYWRLFAYGHVGVLEAYFDGQLDIEGSLARTLAAGMEGGMDQRGGPLIWLRNRWHELTHSNSARAQARANAEAHYALPPEFYKLWLDDPLMFYTCAYWTEETRTLEEALHYLRADKALRDGFGAAFIDYYCRIKEAEIARFNLEVSDWEHREYFDLF